MDKLTEATRIWRALLKPMLGRLKEEFGLNKHHVELYAKDVREHRLEELVEFAGGEAALSDLTPYWRIFLVELTAVRMLLAEAEKSAAGNAEVLQRNKTMLEVRGIAHDERSTADKPYSAESYVAQYGITKEEARALVERATSHGEVTATIQRLFAMDSVYRERAMNFVVRPEARELGAEA